MRLVIDASVAVKWAVAEEGHLEALSLVSAGHDLLVPDFIFVEVGNALWKKAIRRDIGAEQAFAAAREIRIAFSELIPTVELAERALEMAIELEHPVYDCVYLAAAEEYEATLVTADSRLLARIASTALAALVRSLAEVARS